MLDYAREEPNLTVLGYSVLLSGAYTRSAADCAADGDRRDSR